MDMVVRLVAATVSDREPELTAALAEVTVASIPEQPALLLLLN